MFTFASSLFLQRAEKCASPRDSPQVMHTIIAPVKSLKPTLWEARIERRHFSYRARGRRVRIKEERNKRGESRRCDNNCRFYAANERRPPRQISVESRWQREEIILRTVTIVIKIRMDVWHRNPSEECQPSTLYRGSLLV